MKKIILLFAALLIVSYSPAQGFTCYVNGQKVSPELLGKIPAEHIESMNKSVEEGVPVLRIELKAGAELPAPDAPSVSPGSVKNRERVRQVMQQEYDRTTLLRQGERAADFIAPRFDGDSVSLASLRGKVVLINFWATWCGPCLAELELLPERVLARFAGDPGFVFLPVAYTDSAESLSKFFATERGRSVYAYLRESTAMDPDKSVFNLFATQGVPRTVVVGRDGVILCGTLGNTEENLEAMVAAIAAGLQR